MKAKKKPITSVTPQELGVQVSQQLATLKVGAAAAACSWVYSSEYFAVSQ
jgi:electron transfer flavoprotein alpha/beta subunit